MATSATSDRAARRRGQGGVSLLEMLLVVSLIAIATGQPQRFVIDPAARTWQAPDGHDGEIPEALQVRFTGAREAQPAEGEGAVMFFNDGAATGGRIQLSRDGAAWNIDVAWLTGEVTLARAGDDR